MKKLLIFMVFILTSCTTEISYQDLIIESEKTYRHSLTTSFVSEFKYIGSDEEYDYFKIIHYPFRDDTYKVKRNETNIKERHPLWIKEKGPP